MSLRGSSSIAIPFVGVALLTSVARADVLVVDPSNGPYTFIGTAVDAASDGDVILVRGGSSGAIFIDGKSLTIIADAGVEVPIGSIVIMNVAASQQVTIAGLGLQSPSPDAPNGSIEINSCDGPVRIIESKFGGGTLFLTYPPPPAAFIASSADVSFNGCRIEGLEEAQHGGSVALFVKDSTLSMWNSILRGGQGRDGEPWFAGSGHNWAGGEGLAAIHCDSSSVYLSGCRLTGGRGGPGVDGTCGDPIDVATPGGLGAGAIGVFNGFDAIPSLIRALDNVFIGGMGGAGGSNSCESAPNGQPGPSGTPPAWALPGSARAMSPVECAAEGASLLFSFRGAPGDRVYLGIATESDYAYVPSMHGPLLLADRPLRSKFVGVIGASGILDALVPVTELGSGVDAIVRQAQGILVSADGSTWLTGGSPMVRLDGAL